MLSISTHWNWEKEKLNVMSTNSGVRHCNRYSSMKLGLVSHVLKIEKLRLRELEQLVQTHTAGKLRGWDQRPHTVFVRSSFLELLKTSLPAGLRPPQPCLENIPPRVVRTALISSLLPSFLHKCTGFGDCYWVDLVSLGLPFPVRTMAGVGQSGSWLEDGRDTAAITLGRSS